MLSSRDPESARGAGLPPRGLRLLAVTRFELIIESSPHRLRRSGDGVRARIPRAR